MNDGKRCVVYSPVIFVKMTGTSIRSFNARIFPRKMENKKFNVVVFAVKKSFKNVELDVNFWRTFLPEGNKIGRIGVPDNRRRRRNETRKNCFLQC